MIPKKAEAAQFSGSRPVILGAIKSPLGFFALALLIVEGFLMGAGIFFDLPLEYKMAALIVGVLLFLVVFGTVAWLVVKHPQSLVFSEQSHVVMAALTYGDETQSDKLEGQPTANPIKPTLPPSTQTTNIPPSAEGR